MRLLVKKNECFKSDLVLILASWGERATVRGAIVVLYWGESKTVGGEKDGKSGAKLELGGKPSRKGKKVSQGNYNRAEHQLLVKTRKNLMA